MKKINIIIFLLLLTTCSTIDGSLKDSEKLKKSLIELQDNSKDPKAKKLLKDTVKIVEKCDKNFLIMQSDQEEIKALKTKVSHYRSLYIKGIFSGFFRLTITLLIGVLIGRFFWGPIVSFITTLLGVKK